MLESDKCDTTVTFQRIEYYVIVFRKIRRVATRFFTLPFLADKVVVFSSSRWEFLAISKRMIFDSISILLRQPAKYAHLAWRYVEHSPRISKVETNFVLNEKNIIKRAFFRRYLCKWKIIHWSMLSLNCTMDDYRLILLSLCYFPESITIRCVRFIVFSWFSDTSHLTNLFSFFRVSVKIDLKNKKKKKSLMNKPH